MAAQAAATAPATTSTWLHGRAADLLLGAGLGYIVTIPLLVYWSSSHGVTAWSAGLTLGMALLISGPHYGATLLRVYEQRSDRRKYVFFSVYMTLALIALGAVALENVLVGSLVVTAYVTWSPWHFAGQNYGIALMFLRRRGVRVDPLFKRFFYLSFVLSSALAMLSIHRAGSGLVYAQGASSYRVFSILRLGVPPEIVQWLAPLLGVLYVGTLVGAFGLLLRRGGRPRDLLEPGLLVATQALWFALPALGAMTQTVALAGLAFTPIWISTAHAIQYLWVTSYYARRSPVPSPTLPFLAKALLASSLFLIPRDLLFAPGSLGGFFSNAAGVGALVFALLNLHHFILDGAIWKLRDGRVASVLLRSESAAPILPGGAGWGRRAVFGAGALCLLATAYLGSANWIATSPSLPLSQVERANRLLSWLGKGDPAGWTALARRHQQLGLSDRVIEDYRMAVEAVRQQGRTPPSALANDLARLLLAHRKDDPASVLEAQRLALEALESDPDNRVTLDALAASYAAQGDWRRARQVTRRSRRE